MTILFVCLAFVLGLAAGGMLVSAVWLAVAAQRVPDPTRPNGGEL